MIVSTAERLAHMPVGSIEQQAMIQVSTQRRHAPVPQSCGKHQMQGVWGPPAHPAGGAGATPARIHATTQL